MRNVIALFLFCIMIASCSKVTQERLQGTWQATEIKEIPTDIFDVWKDWLDTTTVKVVFFENGSEKAFYLEADRVVGFSGGSYQLLENAEKLIITDTSLIFNSHGYPLVVTLLRRNKMTLEGRYYLHAINPAIAVDSFRTLEWTFSK